MSISNAQVAATMIGLTKITDAFEDNIGYTLVALVTITILSQVNIPYVSTHINLYPKLFFFLTMVHSFPLMHCWL